VIGVVDAAREMTESMRDALITSMAAWVLDASRGRLRKDASDGRSSRDLDSRDVLAG
jgi:hypothetical protein